MNYVLLHVILSMIISAMCNLLYTPTAFAHEIFVKDLKCIYLDSASKPIFNGACAARWNALEQCRNRNAVEERYIIMFTAQSMIAVSLHCDRTASVNGINATYEIKDFEEDGRTVLVATEEGEAFAFSKVGQ